MNTIINNTLIRSLNPCYDPSDVVSDESESLPVAEWASKYRGKLPDKDIVWLLCHSEFLSDKDLRLFAVWCARSVKQTEAMLSVIDVAEKYVNGDATSEELSAAYSAAYSAADSAADSAAFSAADSAADSAAYSAARSAADSAAFSAAFSAQVDKLLTFFK